MMRIVKRGVPMVARPLQRSFWGFPRPIDLPRLMLRDFERQFDHMDSFFRYSPIGSVLPRSLPLEAVETSGNTYKINIDVSGFKPEDIKVSLKDRVLTVDAKVEHKSDDGSRLYQEMSRLYTLPSNVQVDSLKSLLTNDGVLAIEAPFSTAEAQEPKQIPITRTTEEIEAK